MDSLATGAPPLVIFPEVHEDTSDDEYRELVRHCEARVLEGEETRRAISEYFAEVAPSGEKGKASRSDLEPFFQGRVGERVVPLLTELAQGMLRGLCDIPLRNLARNGTDNEISLSSASRLSSLRVSYFIKLRSHSLFFNSPWPNSGVLLCRLSSFASTCMM